MARRLSATFPSLTTGAVVAVAVVTLVPLAVTVTVLLLPVLLHISSNMTLDWSVVVIPLVLWFERFLEAGAHALLEALVLLVDERAWPEPGIDGVSTNKSFQIIYFPSDLFNQVPNKFTL